jgi:pimeloyl-ACP methyl ester carboxylesterase
MSDAGAGDYTPESRAADLIGLIEALSLSQPVIGGHSMGAVTAIYAAVMRPDLISGIIMEDPALALPGEPVIQRGSITDLAQLGKMINRESKFIKRAPEFLVRGLIQRLLPEYADDEYGPWMKSKQLVSGDLIQAMKEPDWLIGQFDFNLLGQVKAPALLLYGDREAGAIVSQGVAQEMAARMPELTVAYFPGANHDVRRVRFDGYLAALRSFLQALMD